MPDAIGKHLFWRFWFFNQREFLHPGVYFRTWRVLPLPFTRPEISLVEFDESNITFAKHQPEYRPLPAHRYVNDPQGRIVFCWRLSWLDRLCVLWRGVIWHQVLTFNDALQPQLLMGHKPPMPLPAGEEHA